LGFFKTLFYKIGKAYKEVSWLRWLTLMVVFVAVELAILIPYYSHLDEGTKDSSVNVESSQIVESSSVLEESDSSIIIVESSTEESSSVETSNSTESSSISESSSEESSVEESSSIEESSSEESSSESESSSEEESGSVEESSSIIEECEHDYAVKSIKGPDCENAGSMLIWCRKCGIEEIVAGESALGHDFQEGSCTRCEKADPDWSGSSEDESSSDSDSSSESSSSEDESSSDSDSSSESSSSEDESSSEEDSSSESSSSEDESSSSDDSSSESSSSEDESSSDADSSSESSSSEDESSSDADSSSESSSSEDESSSEEDSSSESSSSEDESSSEEDSSSESSSSEDESSSSDDSSSESSSSEDESSSDSDECIHVYTFKDWVRADCENPGGIWMYCSNCGIEKFTEGEPALGHDFQEGSCTRCEKADPDWSGSSDEESSSDDSSDDSSSESDSSNEDSSSEVVNCEKHSFTWMSEDERNATCEEEGGIWKTCKYCGYKKFDVKTSALGHEYIDGVCTRCEKIEPSSDDSSDDSSLDSGFEEDSSSEGESSSDEDSSGDSSSDGDDSSNEDGSEDSSSGGDSSSENEDSSGEDSSAPDINVESILKFSVVIDDKGEYSICKGFHDNVDLESVRNIVIPDTYKNVAVTQIESGAFSGNYSLNSVTIGKNVKKIGDAAFWNCPNLMEVYNLSSVKIVAGHYQKGYGLNDYTQIYTDLTISSKISNIGDYIVYSSGQEQILIGYKGKGTVLTLPNGITTINAYAFAANKNVTDITLSDSVIKVSSYAFANCESLKKVVIGSSVTSIGAYAFDNTLLEEVVFPEGDYTWSYNNETLLAKYLQEDPQRAASLFIKGDEPNGSDYTWDRS